MLKSVPTREAVEEVIGDLIAWGLLLLGVVFGLGALAFVALMGGGHLN